MSNIKNWLTLAKQYNVQVTNEAATNDLSLCINLLSIPTTDTVAVSVSFMKNQKKKNAAPPQNFAKVMGVLESIMREIEDDSVIPELFQPVDGSVQWYRVLDCHRIFFITETSTPNFISSFFKRKRLDLIRAQGIKEVCFITATQQYEFNIKI